MGKSRRRNAQNAPRLRWISQKNRKLRLAIICGQNLRDIICGYKLGNSHTNSTIFCATPAKWFSVKFTHTNSTIFCASPALWFSLNISYNLNRILCYTRKLVFCEIHTQTEPYSVLHPQLWFSKIHTQTQPYSVLHPQSGFLWNLHTNSTVFCASPAKWFSESHTQTQPYSCATPAKWFPVNIHTQTQLYFVVHP